MTDNVAPETVNNVAALFGGEVQSSDKQMMLDYVAQWFDDMAADDKAPVCLLFSLVSEKGCVKSGYITSDKIDDRNTLYISRAAMAIQGDYHVWDSIDRPPCG